MPIPRILRASLLLVALAAPAAADKVDLAPTLAPGSTARYSFISENKQESRIVNGREQSSTAATESRLLLRIRPEKPADAAAGALLELTYERLAFHLETATSIVDFDSDKAETLPEEQRGTPMALAVKAIVGAPVLCTLNQAGELVAIDTAAIKPPEGPASSIVRQLLAKDAVADIVNAIFNVRPPPTESGVGDTWTRTRTLPAFGGGMKMKQDYTVAQINPEKAMIRLEGAITLEGTTEEAAKFLTVKQGTVSGATEWDVKAGRAIAVDFSSVAEVEDSNPAMKGVIVVSKNTSKQRIQAIPAAAPAKP